jgi:thioredoxin-related protein
MKRLLIIIAMLFATPSFASPMGDDGLHKPTWLRTTFKDMAEDLEEANTEGKRLMIIFEQRGCIYCKKMHEEVFPQPEISKAIEENFFVVQMNLFGDEEVTDFDGTVKSEKEMATHWGVVFTPTLLFLPTEIDSSKTLAQNAVMTMPGAFGKYTTFNLLNFVLEEGYNSGEHFQKYHARKFAEQKPD